MSNKITWSIQALRVKNIEELCNVVIVASWACSLTGNGTVTGNVAFSAPSDAGSFISYEQLTETQILEWCWKSGIHKESVESSILPPPSVTEEPIELQLPWIVTATD